MAQRKAPHPERAPAGCAVEGRTAPIPSIKPIHHPTRAALAAAAVGPAYFRRMNTKALIAIVAAVIAVIVLSQLLFEFYDWNRQQACATGGGRNCAPRIPLNQHD